VTDAPSAAPIGSAVVPAATATAKAAAVVKSVEAKKRNDDLYTP
jgi:hypothetical protein